MKQTVPVPVTKPSAKANPLKDISNTASTSKTGFLAKPKTFKKLGNLRDDKFPENEVKSHFAFKCDLPISSLNSPSPSSVAAQFGHTPPEEPGEDMVIAPCVSLEQDCENEMVDDTTDNQTNLADNLSSSDEEDMADS